MVKPKSIDYDLCYLQAGLEVIEPYLLSEEIFWPLDITPSEGEPDYLRLTLDGLLLSRTRLLAHPKNADQEKLVEGVLSDLDLQRSRHRVAWERKAGKCYRVRMRMWGDFIQEYQENPADNSDRYSYEVRSRVLLALLSDEVVARDPADDELLNSLDRYLHGILKEGSFIWDSQIQVGFPRDKYWYLYGKLPPVQNKSG